MQHGMMTRRGFLHDAGQASALLTMRLGALPLATGVAATGQEQRLPQQGAPVEPALAQFVERYMQVMYAPGLTLGLVHADGQRTASAFGLSDVARRVPVDPAMLFQIGSISKSFCALALLQMHDEGKLDLQAPILAYLPWLPIEAPLGTITVHHLLTHSSGLPGNTPLFLGDRNARILQTFKPGTQFHYCNLGFQILGHLAAGIDGTSYASVLQRRLLTPLGMHATRPAISRALAPTQAMSYVIERDDLAQGRDAALVVAQRSVFDNAAGCIASTAADMGLYMAMLLAHGKTPSGRIVSAEAFELFAKPYIEAEEFGKGAQYGYGIAVDTLHGHTLLRHTGGMESFASSMQVDLDGRVAAFASINAMQGYRPNPVTKFALQVLRAQAENKPMPEPEPLESSQESPNAHDYVGRYSSGSGTVDVLAEGPHLFVTIDGARVRLVHAEGDSFVASDPAWQTYAWSFTRAEKAGEKPGVKAAVTELTYGPRWYAGAAYAGPKTFARPARWLPFEGTYDDGRSGMRAYMVKGALTLDGSPLAELGEGLFRMTDEPESPETVEFLHVVEGRARLMLFGQSPLWRMETN